jgi:hypothetical protein
MEYIQVKSRSYLLIRKGLGILMAITAVAWFLNYSTSHKIVYLAGSFFFLLYGIYQFANGFGLEKTWIKSDSNSLIIKWNDRIMPVQIHSTRVVKISLERTCIIIFQRSLKPMKLNLGFLERTEKKDLYNFFIEFARGKDIAVERHTDN